MASPIIETETCSWTNATGGTASFTSAIQAGDIIVVSATAQLASNNSVTVTDSNGIAYSKAASGQGTNAVQSTVWWSAAQTAAAAGTFSVTVVPSVGAHGEAAVYLIRATSLSIDTPNVAAGNNAGNSIASGATYSIAAFATTAQAVVIAAVCDYQGGSPTAGYTWASGTALTSDNVSFFTGFNRTYMAGHLLTTGAVSGQAWGVTSSATGTAGNCSWALVPFLYTASGGGITASFAGATHPRAHLATSAAMTSAAIGTAKARTLATARAANALDIEARTRAVPTALVKTGMASHATSSNAPVIAVSAHARMTVHSASTERPVTTLSAELGSIATAALHVLVAGPRSLVSGAGRVAAVTRSRLGGGVAVDMHAKVMAAAGSLISHASRLISAMTMNAAAHGAASVKTGITVVGATGVTARTILRASTRLTATSSAVFSAAFRSLVALGTRLAAALRLQYPGSVGFYVRLPGRLFYNSLQARPFIVSIDAANPGTFDTTDPGETHVLTFDASSNLAPGETLTSVATPIVTVTSGNDTAVSLTVGTPVINTAPITIGSVTIAPGCGVQVVESAGLDGCTYLVSIQADTSNPEKILVVKGTLPVAIL